MNHDFTVTRRGAVMRHPVQRPGLFVPFEVEHSIRKTDTTTSGIRKAW